MPENLWEEVEEFIKYIGYETYLDKIVQITPNPLVGSSLPKGWPSEIKFRDFFLSYLDVFATPRRYFFELCSFFTSSEMEKEKLLEFSSSEGQESLYSYNQRVKRTTYEVLQDFPSVKIPIEYICDLISPMKPRHFSISSSQKVSYTLILYILFLSFFLFFFLSFFLFLSFFSSFLLFFFSSF